jgi:hypothetical protein
MPLLKHAVKDFFLGGKKGEDEKVFLRDGEVDSVTGRMAPRVEYGLSTDHLKSEDKW